MKLDDAAPPLQEIRKRLRYDPETGHFYMLRSGGRKRIGDRAGYADSRGYWKVCVQGCWIMAHRLAWAFINDEWPAGEIDHINCDPSDNRIRNLRVCTRSQNVMNTRRGNGVCWVKARKKWQVIIKAGGKSHYIGHFAERSKADAAAAEAIRRLHGEFSNIAEPAPAPEQTGMDL